MSTTTLRNLRIALGISPESLAVQCRMSLDELSAIESGKREPNGSFINAYSKILNINTTILSVLLKGTNRKLILFEKLRKLALKVLNGYLKLSLWMTDQDEPEKKLPR
ncbi:multiprotein-bridging factor 1 family protein [Halomonas elongata]|uniref:helix-turn-helix domain-containing protein n=1 Tax=Halomonas elongata TaxID=2746 RepID=UPI0038D4044E